MSLRMTVSLVKNYRHILSYKKTSCSFYRCFSTSLPYVDLVEQLSSSVFRDSFHFVKHSQPLKDKSTEEILCKVKSRTSGSEAVILLKALRMNVLFRATETEAIKNDERFKALCGIFQKNCLMMRPNLLVSGLRSMFAVGVQPHEDCVVAAENSIIRNIYKFSLFNIICCLYYHHNFKETELQNDVVSLLVHQMVKQLHMLSTSGEILMLPHISYLVEDEHKIEMDRRITQVVPSLSPHEMFKLACLLAEKSSRNVLILNAIAFHLRLKKESLDLKETISLLYAFKKLNFFEPKLFSFLMSRAGCEILSVEQPSLISGLLSVCGQMRWKNIDILDACGSWIRQNFEVCRTRELVSYVLALGALNYSTSESKSILRLILPQLTLKNIESPEVYLDIIWSLGILDYVSRELLLSVLSSKFYKSLTGSPDSQMIASHSLKLLNLKGILKRDYPECIFGCDLYLEPPKLRETLAIENSRQHVLNVLSNFVPVETCLSTNQVTDTGVFIDAEFIMNQNVKPLSLQEYGVLSKASSSNKCLPDGSQRIAVLIMFHKDFTQNVPSLTGVNALAQQLLKDAGYLVVIVPYNEFSKNKTEVLKAKYLVEEITDVMKSNS